MKFSLLVNVPVFGSGTKNIHKRGVKDPRLTKDSELQSVELTWIVALIRTINKLTSFGNNASEYIYKAACSATSIPLEAVTTDQGRFITVNIEIADHFPSLAAECLGVNTASVNPQVECVDNDVRVPCHPTTRAHDNFMKSAIAATFQKVDDVDLRMLHKSVNDIAASQTAWIMDDLSRMVKAWSTSGRMLLHDVFYVVKNGQPSFSKGVLQSIYERTIRFKHQTEHADAIKNASRIGDPNDPDPRVQTGTHRRITMEAGNDDESKGWRKPVYHIVPVDTNAPPPLPPPPPPPLPPPSLYESSSSSSSSSSSASSNSDTDEDYSSFTVFGPPPLTTRTTRTAVAASIVNDAKKDAEAIVRLRSSCRKLARVQFPLVTPLAAGVEWHTHAKAYHSIWGQ